MEAAAAVGVDAVSEADLREAEVGFLRLLRARLGAHFANEHAEDLLAQARKEYVAYLAAGKTAYNPPGWLINAAWRRAQELLDYQSRRPQSVPIEAVAELPEGREPTPEQAAIRHDEAEQLRWAMGYLPPKEREMMRLVYFEDLTLAEAGMRVGWSAPNTTRHHRAALARLHSMLEGRLEEIPAMEIGLAAWILANVGQTWSWHALADPLRDLAMEIVDRAADLWRRVLPAADPASASVLAPTLRTAGICGAAVLACVAGGVAGPGLPGVDLPGRDRQPRTVEVATPRGVPQAPLSPPRRAGAAPAASRHSGAASPRRPTLAKARSAPEPRTQRRRPAAGTVARPASGQQTTAEFGIEGRPAPNPAPSPSPTPSARPKPSPPAVSARPATAADGPPDSESGGSSGAEFGL